MINRFELGFGKARLAFVVGLLLVANVLQPLVVKASAAVPTGSLLLDLRANSTSSYSGSGTTWFDLSGNSNNATFQGSPTWSSSLSGSFAMDGTDHFTVPSGMSDFRNGITISVYANFGSSSTTRTWERLVDFGNGSVNNNFLFARFGDTNDLTFEIYNGATSRGHCRFTNGILENTWATYAVTLDGVNCYIYRDGNFAFSAAYNFLPSLIARSNNYIGRSNWADAYFDTGIAAVAIYNRHLNSTEMAALSAGQKDSLSPAITGPGSATGATSSISITENSTAVHTFTADESVTWTKSGTDGSFFSISSGGVLTISARDFESPADSGGNNTYEVIVAATDAAGNAKMQTVTVTITNLNEAPRITVADSSPSAIVSRAENTTTIFTYTGSDSDTASNLTWSISGTDVSFFAVNSSTGALSFITARDFEAAADSDRNNTYIVTLTLSDGALTDTQILTVTVTNANESASINAPTTSGALSKGLATTISVTVNTAGKVRFFVGNKRISTCLARAASGSYPTFTATCSWKPAMTGRQSLTATVTPSDNTYSSSTSSPSIVQVFKRTTAR